jgi:hydrogenase nickel incorporation protein HypA/HybF
MPMHEVSICEHLFALLEQEAARHGVKRIIRLRVEIGRLFCLEPEALRFAFDTMVPGTIAEAAELQIDQPPIRATCKDCGTGIELESRFAPCTRCGSARLEFYRGQEMRLLEMEAG